MTNSNEVFVGEVFFLGMKGEGNRRKGKNRERERDIGL